MLKKEIKFKDYNGKETTAVVYFDLDPMELNEINLEYEKEGGLIGRLNRLMEEKINGEYPRKPIYDFITLLIDRAYGIRPKDDPALFLKYDDNGVPYYRRFKQTLAYKTLVFDLMSGKEDLQAFMAAIYPTIPGAEDAERNKELMKTEAPTLYEIAQQAEAETVKTEG